MGPKSIMKITVFQTGLVPEVLRDQFDGYGLMIADLIDKDRKQFQFEVISVLEGDPVPAIGDVEAIAISGSALGVYDDTDWMDDLRDLIRDAYARKIPMLGICFGHQLIADALGGDVRKSEKGWGLGRQQYEVKHRPEFLDNFPDQLRFSVVHQDQVIHPPASASVVAGNEFAPNAVLAYENGAAFSIQAHPEFDDHYTRELLELRKGEVFPLDQANEALKTLDGNNHNQQAGEVFRRFFAQFG